MKMYQLIQWFQLNYPNLQKELLNCNHNFDQKDLNPYHLESDCWSHTMLVCKIAELKSYDLSVRIAALLHDIGKPLVRNINPNNHHIQFFGHEEISANLSKPILSQMVDDKIIDNKQYDEIIQLISQHSLLHNEQDPHNLFMKFKYKKRLYVHLVQLNQCDAIGRFCANNNFDEDKYTRLISYAKNMGNTNDK